MIHSDMILILLNKYFYFFSKILESNQEDDVFNTYDKTKETGHHLGNI